MNLKKYITAPENLITIQWIFTFLILIGILLAGYYLLPMTIEKYQELIQLDVGGTGLVIPFFPIVLIVIIGGWLVALIWQFRFVQKENR